MRPWRPLLLLLSVIIPVWALRAAALTVGEMRPSAIDLRGLVSDLAVAALLVALLRLGLRIERPRLGPWLGRALALGLLLAWVVLAFGNFEHLLANDANLDPSSLKYLGDKTFQGASMLHLSYPWLNATVFASALVAFIAACRAPRHPTRWGFATVSLLLAAQIWPMSDGAIWQQEHVSAALPRVLSGQTQNVVRRGEHIVTPDDMKTDLSGTPRFELHTGADKPNVLLIMLEGITGGHVPAIAAAHDVKLSTHMPLLSARAEESLTAASFIAHQRQTDRGEYALLCGDLPKLSRMSPRMTDVALSGAHRTCLPEHLRRNGYQTAYLQPAPMAFMMKDQFMGKIGFDESLGAGHFKKGYKKGGWGIDDRAFFEQSLKVIKRLEDGEGPWFVAMMTVGTHHPLIVPKSFKALPDEPDFARAARYTDTYLDALLNRMETAGLLKNTLVIITSDEARGFKDGYGGVTRTLSQSWGLLVALAPNAPPQMIKTPYGQSDVALSIVDYAGLGAADSGFHGRSLFRRYAQPRAFAFANIFKRKAFFLNEAGTLTICGERLSRCSAYTRKDDRIFGPGWSKQKVNHVDLRQLVTHVDWSARAIGDAKPPTESHLVAQDRGLIELSAKRGQGAFLFGGQFLYAPAGKAVEVEIDLELDGPGAIVRVGGRLNVEYKDRYKLPKIQPLVHGDRLVLRYTYTQAGPLKRIDTIMTTRRLSTAPARLIAHRARVRIIELPKGMAEDAGASLKQLEVRRRDHRGEWARYEDIRPMRRKLSIFTDDRYHFSKCVRRDLRGRIIAKRCRGGRPILGPYEYVVKGSTVQGRFVLKGLSEAAEVRIDLVANTGKTKIAAGDWVRIAPGQTVTLTTEATLEDTHKLVEMRLTLRGVKKKPIKFEVLEGLMEVTPPSRRSILGHLKRP